MKQYLKFTLPAALAALILSPGIAPAVESGEACLAIGGLGMPNFVAEEDGTITIVAPLSGSVGAASGTIYAQRETDTGLEMHMEHYFMTKEGGFLHTKDIGTLTRVEGRENRFMIEITYDIQEESAGGPLAGYGGSFKSYGLVDLDAMQGLVRYSGEICR